MTPRQSREAQTNAEIARGREIVERNRRMGLIEKWEKEKLALVMYPKDVLASAPYGDRPVLVSVHDQTFRDTARYFPSPKLIADVLLALEFDK